MTPEEHVEHVFINHGKVSGIQMCELISQCVEDSIGRKIAPEDIWNSSPTGELAHVYEMYWNALAFYGHKDIAMDISGMGKIDFIDREDGDNRRPAKSFFRFPNGRLEEIDASKYK